MSGAIVEVAGERLALLAERAVHWPRRGMLVVADLHLGKAASFRAAGVPIPRGSTEYDLLRLDQALERSGAHTLLVLGDLLHARAGLGDPATRAAILAWRARWPALAIRLVRGNHDLHAGDPPNELAVQCLDEPWTDGPFCMRHHPAESPGYTLAGHVHPAVRLEGAGRQRTSAAAFVFGPRVGLLPAFGSFTGTAIVSPGPDDRVFVPVDDEVIALPRTNPSRLGT